MSVWRIECADGASFECADRADAEDRFWDAVRRSSIAGVWKLLRPDGETFVTVVCDGRERVLPHRAKR